MTNSTLSRHPARLSSNGSYERVLPFVPAARLTTDELRDECQRRGLVVLDGARPLSLPDLVIQAGGQVVRWRGVEYRFGPMAGRVVLALAHRWPGTLNGRALALAVWGPYVHENLGRAHVCWIRVRAPGLIETVTGQGGYRLNLRAES